MAFAKTGGFISVYLAKFRGTATHRTQSVAVPYAVWFGLLEPQRNEAQRNLRGFAPTTLTMLHPTGKGCARGAP
jgi:hypothetical protein